MHHWAASRATAAFSILLVCLFVPAQGVAVHAACDPRAADICKQVDQTTQQAGGVRARLEHIKNQISDLETRDLYLAQLIQQIRGQISSQQKAIQETQSRIGETERQIRFNQADITRREAHLAVRQQLLDLRVRTLARHGSIDYLALLVTATSFTQLIDRIGLMQDIIQSDQRMVGDLRRQHDQVQELMNQLNRRRVQLTRLFEQEKAQQDRLQGALQAQQQALAYQKQLEDQLSGQRQAMENELATLDSQLAQLRQRYQEKISGLGAAAGPFIWPIGARYITQRFGCTDLQGEPYWPSCPSRHFHTGLDIGGPDGSPIYAAAAGVVIFAGWNDGGYGNRTIIAHAGGYTTTYNHQSSIVVSAGQNVQQGQVIGYEGSTGFSTGPHLHFEILVNDNFQDPCAYLGC
jgi:murein DD-endopeptidase MepM/ murein hydrolase activator NlpD